MMTEPTEAEGPIYNLAWDCEKLFIALCAQGPTSLITGLIDDYRQQFATWCAYLGVFARPSQCLDRRLWRLPDIQDIVFRLLDSLGRSLTLC